MSTVKFTATKLVGTGKRGMLKPDSDGYYTMPIGGLNTFNSAGEYYLLEGAKQLFEQSSILMRRISNGCLKGEVGHPKKLPGMSNDDFINRIMSVDEKNVCCHFKEIWLDENYGKNNPQFKNPMLVGVMAKIKPSGPKGASLQASLDNPDENVCFSIRALTRDYFERGQTFRVLSSIVAWDFVCEPGISVANKWASPSLESLTDQVVTKRQLESIAYGVGASIATEDSRAMAIESLKVFAAAAAPTKPLYNAW